MVWVWVAQKNAVEIETRAGKNRRNKPPLALRTLNPNWVRKRKGLLREYFAETTGLVV